MEIKKKEEKDRYEGNARKEERNEVGEGRGRERSRDVREEVGVRAAMRINKGTSNSPKQQQQITKDGIDHYKNSGLHNKYENECDDTKQSNFHNGDNARHSSYSERINKNEMNDDRVRERGREEGSEGEVGRETERERERGRERGGERGGGGGYEERDERKNRGEINRNEEEHEEEEERRETLFATFNHPGSSSSSSSSYYATSLSSSFCPPQSQSHHNTFQNNFSNKQANLGLYNPLNKRYNEDPRLEKERHRMKKKFAHIHIRNRNTTNTVNTLKMRRSDDGYPLEGSNMESDGSRFHLPVVNSFSLSLGSSGISAGFGSRSTDFDSGFEEEYSALESDVS